KTKSLTARTDLAARTFSSDKISPGRLHTTSRSVDQLAYADGPTKSTKSLNGSGTPTRTSKALHDANVRTPAKGPRPSVKSVESQLKGTKSGAAVDPSTATGPTKTKKSQAVGKSTKGKTTGQVIEKSSKRTVQRSNVVDGKGSSVSRATRSVSRATGKTTRESTGVRIIRSRPSGSSEFRSRSTTRSPQVRSQSTTRGSGRAYSGRSYSGSGRSYGSRSYSGGGRSFSGGGRSYSGGGGRSYGGGGHSYGGGRASGGGGRGR
ncbi:MAG TPA: hypothetical protein VFR10_04130, partial [bacterium]|nr:hypothetical protein [bacterium]